MQLQLLKPETQSKSTEFASALDKMQFRRVEVPSQEHYMVYPRFSYIIRTRKYYISFKSNNKLASKWRNNLKSKQHFHTNASWNYLILNMAVWWGSQGGLETGGEGGCTDEQHLSDKPPLMQCGETYCTWQ